MEHYILALFGSAGAVLGGAESFFGSLLYFIITIFVIVTAHEFGHFISGRIFGMRVPVFSIGYGRRLIGFNKINGITIGPLNAETESKLTDNTDYRISLVPAGGYARIEGMIDETQKEELPEEVKPWEFRAKPWWQKSIVISAGVIMNVLLAWGIYSGRNLVYGAEGWATTTVGYVAPGSISAAKGIQPGDKILSVDQKHVATWQDIEQELGRHLGQAFSIQMEHDGKPYSVVVSSAAAGDVKNAEQMFGLEPVGLAPVMDSVIAGDPAAIAGMMKDDSVIAVNGTKVALPDTFIAEVSSHAMKPIAIEVSRHGVDTTLTITPNAAGKIGVLVRDFNGPTVTIHYGLIEAAGLGWTNLWTVLRLNVYGIAQVIAGKMPASQAFAGPVKIAAYASKFAAGGIDSFLFFMGLLSISLALINILPIPALDGGHLLIILIEAAIGHELSQKFKVNFQRVGIALILFLLIFMTINDIRTL